MPTVSKPIEAAGDRTGGGFHVVLGARRSLDPATVVERAASRSLSTLDDAGELPWRIRKDLRLLGKEVVSR